MPEQSLNFARKGIRSINKLLCLMLLSIALLMLDNHYSVVQQAKKYVATAIYPIQWLANQPVEWFEYGSAFVQSQNYLLLENQRLTAENTRLKIEIGQSLAQVAELQELKKLFALQNQGVPATTAAQVISYGKDPLSNRLILDKGSQHTLQAGDAVLDESGLMGQLKEVHPFSSEVTLLTDAKMVVPIRVARTGVHSLMYGDGTEITLRYFPVDADLQAGDILLTSGLDSVYPSGIPVAKVLSAERLSNTPYYQVRLKVLANLRSSKYVLLVSQQTSPINSETSVASGVPK